jgi:hypothetical protein
VRARRPRCQVPPPYRQPQAAGLSHVRLAKRDERSLIRAPDGLLGLEKPTVQRTKSHNGQRVTANSFRSLRRDTKHSPWPRIWDRCKGDSSARPRYRSSALPSFWPLGPTSCSCLLVGDRPWPGGGSRTHGGPRGRRPRAPDRHSAEARRRRGVVLSLYSAQSGPHERLPRLAAVRRPCPRGLATGSIGLRRARVHSVRSA